MKVWIDIENPPQVQYLLPFRRRFERVGAQTVVTARNHDGTYAMLEREGLDFVGLGALSGGGNLRKAGAMARRAWALERFLRSCGRPDVLIAASRAAAVAARRLGVPAFIIDDYEFADLAAYRVSGATILHPDAIDARVLRRRGLRRDQLLAFRGLKEDLTFADVDVGAAPRLELDGADDRAVRVIFRPPSETSHYYRRESKAMARAVLERLARSGALVILAPREPGQRAYVEGLRWVRQPLVLTRPVPFLSLLLSADLVVCSGGTMLREAAYLGIPAYSILQSRIGGVDRRLRDLGRVELLGSAADVVRIRLVKRGRISRLDTNPGLLDDVAALVFERAGAPSGARSRSGCGHAPRPSLERRT